MAAECISKFSLLAYRGVNGKIGRCEVAPRFQGTSLKAIHPGIVAEMVQGVRDADDESTVEAGMEAMDRLLHESFVTSVVKSFSSHGMLGLGNAGDSFPSRDEGFLHMPMKGTKLYTDFMRPHRPAGCSLNVKASSYQTLGKFLDHLQSEGLLSLKPGLTDPLVLKIHYDHPTFGLDLPARLPSKSSSCSVAKPKLSLTSLSSLDFLSLRPSWTSRSRSSSTIDDRSTAATPRSTSSTIGDDSISSFSRNDSSVKGSESTSAESGEACKESEGRLDDESRWLDSCGWTTGEFRVSRAWNQSKSWGDEVSLEVKEGDIVYVSSVDDVGWAKATVESSDPGIQTLQGACGVSPKREAGCFIHTGWIPANVLQRFVRVTSSSFEGGPGYLKLEDGDRVAVYHRENDWVYGAKIHSFIGTVEAKDGVATKRDQVLAEGWFPTAFNA